MEVSKRSRAVSIALTPAWLNVRAARWLARLGVSLAALIVLALPTVASGYVYWSNSVVSGSPGTTLGRANLDGSAADPGFIAGAKGPDGIAVDATHVYWVNSGTNSIGRSNLDGTGVDKTFLTGAAGPYGVAVDGAHLYWTNSSTNTIGRADLDGTNPNQSFITGASFPQGVAVDGAHVYWTNQTSNTIGRANLDGTGVDQSFITGTDLHAPWAIAVTASRIYWGNAGAGTIGRASLSGVGANARPLVTGANGTTVAVDGSHLYWTASGMVMRASLGGQGAVALVSTGSSNAGLAVDPYPDSTSTALACSPATTPISTPTNCTATVSDTASNPLTPGGMVTFAATGGGTFSGPAHCTLITSAGGVSGCQVTYTPSAPGPQTLKAAYSGETTHAPSDATTTVMVTTPTNTFKLGSPKLNRRHGTAKLPVKVPDAGTVRVKGSRIKAESATATGRMTLRLEIRGKRKTVRALHRKRHARVEVRATFTPTGGTAKTKRKTLTLRLAGSH